MKVIKQSDPISWRTFAIAISDRIPFGQRSAVKREARKRLAWQIEDYNHMHPSPLLAGEQDRSGSL